MYTTYVVCNQCQQTNRVQVNSSKEPICGHCKSALPLHDFLIEAKTQSLTKLIAKSPLPVVVDIWAPWCGPCRSFAPTFESASKSFAGKAVFVKLNSEDEPQLPSQWGVRGIPTLIVFKNGNELTRQSGAMPLEMFSEWIQKFV